MDIVNFFEKVEGTWFSQRSTHFAQGQPSQTGQALLTMVRLESSDPRIVRFCEPLAISPDQITFALHVQQEAQPGAFGTPTPMPKRATVIVGVKEDTDTGRFYSQTEQEPTVEGHYQLQDEVLTLTTQKDAVESEERIWFMNPNLRMRTNLLTRQDGFRMASFCSEIRRSS